MGYTVLKHNIPLVLSCQAQDPKGFQILLPTSLHGGMHIPDQPANGMMGKHERQEQQTMRIRRLGFQPSSRLISLLQKKNPKIK